MFRPQIFMNGLKKFSQPEYSIKHIKKLPKILIFVHNLARYGVFWNSIKIECSSFCQLACPSCSQTLGELKNIGKGHLVPKDFSNLLKNNTWGDFENVSRMVCRRHSMEKNIDMLKIYL